MYGKAAPKELTRPELDAARLGFARVLRLKGMSPHFRERNAEELLAQALFEYSRQLAEGRRIDSPVGWIITCAWHRAVGLLETRDWRPREVSTERAGEPVDEDRRALPEEAFLALDRQRKVREAVAMLPTYQRQLMALSYFEGQSVREAARQLRWTPSKAQRAHEAAQRQLQRLLGVESSDELQLEIGLAAFLSLAARSSGPLHLPGGLEAALHDGAARAAHLLGRLAQLARRPFSRAGPKAPEGAAAPHTQPGAELGARLLASGAAETAGAAAGGGWQAAEVCKAAVAACLVGGSLVTGAVLGAGGQGHPRPEPSPRPNLAARSQARRASAASASSAPSPASASASPSQAGSGSSGASEAPRRPAGEQPSAATRKATRREGEEREAEEHFSAFAQAAREAEAPSASGASDSSTTATLASASTPESPEEQREEREAHRQFRGGLP